MRRRRSDLAALASGLFVGALLLTALAPGSPLGPPPMAAADEQCKPTPTLCATVTVSITGDGYGHVYSQSNGSTDGFIDCVRYGSYNQGHCTTKYYIADATNGRTISLVGASTPSGATDVCDAAGCSTNFIVVQVTLFRNQSFSRPYTMLLVNAVNVEVTRIGNGYVSSSPFGIACGTDCAQHLPGGYPVTLTADPADGSVFVSFTGHPDCSTKQSTCTFTPTVNTFITATFMVPTPPPTAPPAATKTPSPTPSKTPRPTPSKAPIAKPPTPPPTAGPNAPPTPTPLAQPTAAGPPGTAPPSDAPLPSSVEAPTESPDSGAAAPSASLPPIATRAPDPASSAAPGDGDLGPWLGVILVTLVVVSGYVLLGRFRHRGSAGQ